jgi:hypothetical protein
MKKNFGPKIHPTMELFIVILFLFSEALTAQSFTIPREHYYYQACLCRGEASASSRQVKVKVDRVIDGDTTMKYFEQIILKSIIKNYITSIKR